MATECRPARAAVVPQGGRGPAGGPYMFAVGTLIAERPYREHLPSAWHELTRFPLKGLGHRRAWPSAVPLRSITT